MPHAFFGKNLALVLTTGIALWLAAGLVRADEPARGFTAEQIYAAFVEPALAENGGRIPAHRREAILEVARKVLDQRQMKELEQKLAPYCDLPGGFTVLPDLSDPPRGPMAPAAGYPGADPRAAAGQQRINSFVPPQPSIPVLPPGTANPARAAQPTAPANSTLSGLLAPFPQPEPPAYPSSSFPFPSYPAEIVLPRVERPVDDGPGEQAWNRIWVAEQRGATKYFDNLQLFIGLDGAKGPEDLGINALMGERTSFNWGIPILENIGLGLQVGSAVNYGEDAVGVLQTVNDTHYRVQSFTTLGIFQRTEMGFNWGVAWDYLYEHYWADFSLNQVRAQIGYEFNANNEIGVWGTYGPTTTSAYLNSTPFYMQSINQSNVFWRHVWPNQAVTRIWMGVAEVHDRFILVNPNRPPALSSFVYGADVYIPLNSWISIFGEANFITPNDTGTVTATFGLAFSLGGRAQNASRDRFAPLLPVANNTSFAVNLWK